MYRIIISRAAEKQIGELPRQTANAVIKKIDDLSSEPRPVGCKKLEGYDKEYRIRSGDYRIIYRIQDDVLIVEIIRLGHRREVYRKK